MYKSTRHAIAAFFIIILASSSVQANFFKGIKNLMFGNNLHVLQKGQAYRAGTIPPKRLARKIKKFGIRTVINLRGAQPHKRWFQRQDKVLRTLRIGFYNIPMSAKTLPSRENALKLIDLFDHAPRPILIHCRAGADRTSEAAALWKLTQEGSTKQEARRQLSDTYGHFSNRYPAKKLFISLLPDNPTQIRSWLRNHYNPGKYRRFAPAKA